MNNYLFFKNKIKTINSDLIGAISAFLCIIHCSIVPILMGIHSVYYAGDALASNSHAEHSHTHSSAHSLDSINFLSLFEDAHWHFLDYFFVVITLVAVFFATRKSVVSWITTGLWSSASLFVISILLEESIEGIEYLAYVASALLIVFHLLNQRLGKKINLNIELENDKIEPIITNELSFEKNSFETTINLETERQSKKSNRISCAC